MDQETVRPAAASAVGEIPPPTELPPSSEATPPTGRGVRSARLDAAGSFSSPFANRDDAPEEEEEEEVNELLARVRALGLEQRCLCLDEGRWLADGEPSAGGGGGSGRRAAAFRHSPCGTLASAATMKVALRATLRGYGAERPAGGAGESPAARPPEDAGPDAPAAAAARARHGNDGPAGRPPNPKRKRNVIIAATGSVASVKVPALAGLLQGRDDFCVKVIASDRARHFFDESEVDAPVLTDKDEWNAWKRMSDPVLHVQLRSWADLIVVAPLDANTLAKLACGLCDNLVTCTLRAWDREKLVVLCPAMNTFMWTHPHTAAHLDAVRKLGYIVVAPVSKVLACGDTGVGAMAEPATIAEVVRQLLSPEGRNLGC